MQLSMCQSSKNGVTKKKTKKKDMPNHFPGDPCSVYTGDDIFPEFPLFRAHVYSANSLVRFAHSLVNKGNKSSKSLMTNIFFDPADREQLS